jgi:mannosyltransferase
LRLLNLAHKPFWFDECFSVEVAQLDPANFLHLLWRREANMSLYYLLLRVWLHFGQSEFFIRGFSVLISAATLPAIYWLAAKLYDRRVALISAALFTFNAYSLRYAQEARSYALLLLLATLSSGFLVAFLRAPARRGSLGYILASALAVYAHFYAMLLLAAHWLVLRFAGRPGAADGLKAEVPSQVKCAGKVIGLALLPLLVFIAKTGAGPIRWIPRPGFHDVFQFYEHLAGGSTWFLAAVCGIACAFAVAPARRRLLARHQAWDVWRCQFLLAWLFFPPLLTALLSLARPVFLARYLIFCLPALVILAAAGLARLRPAWLLGAALTGVLGLCMQGVLFVYDHDFDTERDGSGAATNFILDHCQSGDAVMFHIAAARVPYEFFRSLRAGKNTASPDFTAQLGPEIVFPRHSAGLDCRDFMDKPSPGFLRTLGSGHSRLWVVLLTNTPAGRTDPTTEMLSQVLPEVFPKMVRRQFPKIEVRLYSKQ